MRTETPTDIGGWILFGVVKKIQTGGCFQEKTQYDMVHGGWRQYDIVHGGWRHPSKAGGWLCSSKMPDKTFSLPRSYSLSITFGVAKPFTKRHCRWPHLPGSYSLVNRGSILAAECPAKYPKHNRSRFRDLNDDFVESMAASLFLQSRLKPYTSFLNSALHSLIDMWTCRRHPGFCCMI